MVEIEGTLYCDGCGIEIIGPPVKKNKRYYCCRDCADGLECDCKPEIDRERLYYSGSSPYEKYD